MRSQRFPSAAGVRSGIRLRRWQRPGPSPSRWTSRGRGRCDAGSRRLAPDLRIVNWRPASSSIDETTTLPQAFRRCTRNAVPSPARKAGHVTTSEKAGRDRRGTAEGDSLTADPAIGPRRRAAQQRPFGPRTDITPRAAPPAGSRSGIGMRSPGTRIAAWDRFDELQRQGQWRQHRRDAIGPVLTFEGRLTLFAPGRTVHNKSAAVTNRPEHEGRRLDHVGARASGVGDPPLAGGVCLRATTASAAGRPAEAAASAMGGGGPELLRFLQSVPPGLIAIEPSSERLHLVSLSLPSGSAQHGSRQSRLPRGCRGHRRPCRRRLLREPRTRDVRRRPSRQRAGSARAARACGVGLPARATRRCPGRGRPGAGPVRARGLGRGLVLLVRRSAPAVTTTRAWSALPAGAHVAVPRGRRGLAVAPPGRSSAVALFAPGARGSRGSSRPPSSSCCPS